MSNFISCKGCAYENHPQKCQPEQGCYEDKYPTGILGEKHRLAQDISNKNHRNLIDILNNTEIKAHKLNVRQPRGKPMNNEKCKTCTGNAERTSCPPVLNMQPDRCSSCGDNPLINVSNHEPKPIEWPPEEWQEIWSVSSRGDIFLNVYNANDFVNLVNVYPTKEKAEQSVKVLLEARKLTL